MVKLEDVRVGDILLYRFKLIDLPPYKYEVVEVLEGYCRSVILEPEKAMGKDRLMGQDELNYVDLDLDAARLNKYIKYGGTSCLFCGDFDIAGDSFETDEHGVTQDVRCQKCGSSWTDVYRLVEVRDIEKGEQS